MAINMLIDTKYTNYPWCNQCQRFIFERNHSHKPTDLDAAFRLLRGPDGALYEVCLDCAEIKRANQGLKFEHKACRTYNSRMTQWGHSMIVLAGRCVCEEGPFAGPGALCGHIRACPMVKRQDPWYYSFHISGRAYWCLRCAFRVEISGNIEKLLMDHILFHDMADYLSTNAPIHFAIRPPIDARLEIFHFYFFDPHGALNAYDSISIEGPKLPTWTPPKALTLADRCRQVILDNFASYADRGPIYEAIVNDYDPDAAFRDLIMGLSGHYGEAHMLIKAAHGGALKMAKKITGKVRMRADDVVLVFRSGASMYLGRSLGDYELSTIWAKLHMEGESRAADVFLLAHKPPEHLIYDHLDWGKLGARAKRKALKALIEEKKSDD